MKTENILQDITCWRIAWMCRLYPCESDQSWSWKGVLEVFIYFKIQPVETKGLNQTEDGFTKETGLINKPEAAVDTGAYLTHWRRMTLYFGKGHLLLSIRRQELRMRSFVQLWFVKEHSSLTESDMLLCSILTVIVGSILSTFLQESIAHQE